MSEKMTRIQLRGSATAGLMEWGEQTSEYMLHDIREYAERRKAEAEAILAAADEDFDVDIVRGPVVERFVRRIWPRDID